MNKAQVTITGEEKLISDFANPRLLGIYPQKQEGLYMLRTKIPGGKIDWKQWRAIAAITQEYTTAAMHLTTRQDIELHDVPEDKLATVITKLNDVGLTTVGACGDAVRNVTVCSGCGLTEGSADVSPLAETICEFLEALPASDDLPRKFKISLSCCEKACAKPYISDLGFIAKDDGSFDVAGAGSLGARPGIGIKLFEGISANDILPLCAASLEMFAEHGDRENRRKARFRHIRERFGDEAFIKELSERFESKKIKDTWPDVMIERSEKTTPLVARIQLINGNILPDDAIALADAAEKAGAIIRVSFSHGLELYGDTPIELPEDLKRLEGLPKIVACPGTSTCPNGIVNCQQVAGEIFKLVIGKIRSDVTINISGCPNNCVHSAVADIGLVGMIRTIGSERTECYRVFTDGGNGENDKLAEKQQVVSAQEVPQIVMELLEK